MCIDAGLHNKNKDLSGLIDVCKSMDRSGMKSGWILDLCIDVELSRIDAQLVHGVVPIRTQNGGVAA